METSRTIVNHASASGIYRVGTDGEVEILNFDYADKRTKRTTTRLPAGKQKWSNRKESPLETAIRETIEEVAQDEKEFRITPILKRPLWAEIKTQDDRALRGSSQRGLHLKTLFLLDVNGPFREDMYFGSSEILGPPCFTEVKTLLLDRMKRELGLMFHRQCTAKILAHLAIHNPKVDKMYGSFLEEIRLGQHAGISIPADLQGKTLSRVEDYCNAFVRGKATP